MLTDRDQFNNIRKGVRAVYAELEYGPVPSLGQHDAAIRKEFGPETP